MNILSKQLTRSFFKNDDGYKNLEARWKSYVNSPECSLKSSDYLFYSIVRGKDYKKAFFPGRKMEHYDCPEGLYIALAYGFRSKFKELFSDILVEDWHSKATKIIPSVYRCDLYNADSYDNEMVHKLLNQEVIV